MSKTAHRRIQELDKQLDEGEAVGPWGTEGLFTIGLKAVLAMATAIIEVAMSIDEVARAIRSTR